MKLRRDESNGKLVDYGSSEESEEDRYKLRDENANRLVKMPRGAEKRKSPNNNHVGMSKCKKTHSSDNKDDSYSSTAKTHFDDGNTTPKSSKGSSCSLVYYVKKLLREEKVNKVPRPILGARSNSNVTSSTTRSSGITNSTYECYPQYSGRMSNNSTTSFMSPPPPLSSLTYSPSPPPFWANVSPQSDLNSPLYGKHPPRNQDMASLIPKELSYTPQKTDSSVYNLATNPTPPSKLGNSATLQQYSQSPVYITSSVMTPQQRFLRNSCLVNKNNSLMNNNLEGSSSTSTPASIEWKKQFKTNSDSYGVKYIDSHCHLDFLLQRQQFKGSWEQYRVIHQDTFPETYEGCVAVFCSPGSFRPDGM